VVLEALDTPFASKTSFSQLREKITVLCQKILHWLMINLRKLYLVC